ncbi:MAG: NAD(P)-dependent oxidoreductase [Burkholderiaceae bacterium]|nr:NAD(P)-dependent oxidoreductase [Burkholderiaceae bacterium]
MIEKVYTKVAPRRVTFIGLGVMGYPMAGHLACAGHHVTVYNRTRSVADKWCHEFGGQLALTPREAVKDAEIVITCVSNDKALEEVVLGENGAFAGMKSGAVLWDDSTVSLEITKKLYQKANSLGLHFVDAPVSGGQNGAEKGVLTMMCGGDSEVITEWLPIINAYAPSAERIGSSGQGQLSKMCNQICIAGILQSLSEAIAFGELAHLDMNKVLNVISKGAASSWQMQNRGQSMIEDRYDFGFAVDLMRKDLGICLSAAREVGATLPTTALIDQFYADIQNSGGNKWDTSSLITRLRNK